MLLGGLWHGAAWTFVVWGFFHGCLIVATHQLAALSIFKRFSDSRHWLLIFFKWAVTFYLVLITWVLFRAPDLATALSVLTSMHGLQVLPAAQFGAGVYFVLTIVALALMHLIDLAVIRGSIEKRAWLLWPFLIFLQTLCFIVGAPSDAFIYFQF